MDDLLLAAATAATVLEATHYLLAISTAQKILISAALTQTHITYAAPTANMAQSMTTPEHTPHNCVEIAKKDLKIRPDLLTSPLDSPQLTMYTDGCCYKGDKGNVALYAVIQENQGEYTTLEADKIPQPASAQLAEIHTPTQALELAEGKTTNIYTNSAYGHGGIHVDGPQWLRRGFLTSANTPVKHAEPRQ